MSAKKSNETTLTQLTKRFVKLLNSSSERVVNLNEASSKLSVAKRRIYDITNVLEGIGLLQKTSKNVTRWIDCPAESPLAAPTPLNTTATTNVDIKPVIITDHNNATTTTINGNNNQFIHHNNNHHNHQQQQQQHHHLTNGLPDSEMMALLKTYHALEEGVNELEANIRQQLSADGAYVTYQDIKSFFDDQIVIAVKAPPETRLEVNESLQIWMKSEGGEIEVYLCPQYGNNNSNSNNNNNNSNNNNTTTTSNPNTNNTINSINSSAQQQQQSQPQVPQSQVAQPQQQQTPHLPQQAQQQQINGYQVNNNESNNNNNINNSPHLQQSQISNSSNTQAFDPTTTNVSNQNMIGSQQQYTTNSSDEGRGKSISNTDAGQYYDPTSGVSTDDHYYNYDNNPTLSSALSGATSEDEDPFTCKPIVPFEPREETQYTFMLDESYTLNSLFPEDNLGLY